MTDLTATQKAIRVIVAQHLPRVDKTRCASYAEKVSMAEPLAAMGIGDVEMIHLGIAVEKAFGFVASDDDIERCKTAGDLARLVDQHVSAEAAA